MCTVVEETNIEVILAVMNTTELALALKKFRPVRDLNLYNSSS